MGTEPVNGTAVFPSCICIILTCPSPSLSRPTEALGAFHPSDAAHLSVVHIHFLPFGLIISVTRLSLPAAWLWSSFLLALLPVHPLGNAVLLQQRLQHNPVPANVCEPHYSCCSVQPLTWQYPTQCHETKVSTIITTTFYQNPGRVKHIYANKTQQSIQLTHW